MATGPPHYKIILCGEYGVGKSSIFRRFRDDSIEENMDDRMSTVGLDQCSRLFPMSGIDIKVTQTSRPPLSFPSPFFILSAFFSSCFFPTSTSSFFFVLSSPPLSAFHYHLIFKVFFLLKIAYTCFETTQL